MGKRIIVTVGISLFESYVKLGRKYNSYKNLNYSDIECLYKNLEHLGADDKTDSKNSSDIVRLTKVIKGLWLYKHHENSCEELSALYQFIGESDDPNRLEITLVAADNLLSVLVADLLKDYLGNVERIKGLPIGVVFNNDPNSADTCVMKGLCGIEPDPKKLVEKIRLIEPESIIIAGFPEVITHRLIRNLPCTSFYDAHGEI